MMRTETKRRRGRYERAMAPDPPADCLTVAQISELENVEHCTVRNRIRSGHLPARVEAGLSFPRYVVRKADYWRFVEEQRG